MQDFKKDQTENLQITRNLYRKIAFRQAVVICSYTKAYVNKTSKKRQFLRNTVPGFIHHSNMHVLTHTLTYQNCVIFATKMQGSSFVPKTVVWPFHILQPMTNSLYE